MKFRGRRMLLCHASLSGSWGVHICKSVCGCVCVCIRDRGHEYFSACKTVKEWFFFCMCVWTPRYERNKLLLKEIHNVQYVSCMNPTAGSFTINPRLQVHTHTHTHSASQHAVIHWLCNSLLRFHVHYISHVISFSLNLLSEFEFRTIIDKFSRCEFSPVLNPFHWPLLLV